MTSSTRAPILLEALRGYQECEKHSCLLTVWYKDRDGRVFRRCEQCKSRAAPTTGDKTDG